MRVLRQLSRLVRLFEDQSGQATVEYILMLFIAVAMAASVIKHFIQPYMATLADSFSAQITSTLFNKANLHSLRIGH